MQPDFIPSTDVGFLDWSTNFSTQLTAAPTAIGLVAGDATAYANLHNAYNDAYVDAVTPATRTSVTITSKNVTKRDAIAKARALVKKAQASSVTNDGARVLFGMNIPDPVASEIPAPGTRPLVQVVSNAGNQHTLKLRDEATPTSQKKPNNVLSAEIWVKIDGAPPTGIDQCQYRGDMTRNPFAIAFAGSDTGKPAYYIARWKTARGIVGPESAPSLATIAA
jgi:hypothetical protein